jgi:YVTN family beta-propeller protein
MNRVHYLNLGLWLISIVFAITILLACTHRTQHPIQTIGLTGNLYKTVAPPQLIIFPEDATILNADQILSPEDWWNHVQPGDTLILKRKGFKQQAWRLTTDSLRGTQTLRLQPNTYRVTFLRSEPELYVTWDDEPIEEGNHISRNVPAGWHVLGAMQEGYRSKHVRIWVAEDTTVSIKMTLPESWFIHLRTIPCGLMPKQVTYTPDGTEVIVALLGEQGFERVDAERMVSKEKVIVPGKRSGYVQAVFREGYPEMWITQMETSMVSVYHYPGFELLHQIPANGRFCKVIAFNESQHRALVTNWYSNNLTLLDTQQYCFIKHIPIGKWPRGVVVDNENRYAYIGGFGSGILYQLDCQTWEISNQWHFGGALRDLRMNQAGTLLYISNMGDNRIYEFDLTSFTITRSVTVYNNPNTLRLSPDEQYLLVSCRGPNSPQGYLARSTQPGRIYLIEQASFEILDYIVGGNQPTALDIAPDGKRICFSNFRDHTLEFWELIPPITAN